MNALLATLADSVPNQRALVLDGSSCNSVRCLTGGDLPALSAHGMISLLASPALIRTLPLVAGKHGRGPGDIFVPNNCTETFVKIKALCACTPFYGSVRAFIDSDPLRNFGFLYLDYCCSISAGRFHIEKSPVADIERLFSNKQVQDKPISPAAVCACMA